MQKTLDFITIKLYSILTQILIAIEKYKIMLKYGCIVNVILKFTLLPFT